jgi:DNA-binding transcriptional regulator YiaG
MILTTLTDETAPTPAQIRSAREDLELTAHQAGTLVHVDGARWQRWETGAEAMDAEFWALFRLKTRRLRSVTVRAEPSRPEFA